MSQVKSSVDAASPDAVVITGDIVVSEQVRQLSELLRKLVPGDTHVIVTLGNHEFRERPFEATLSELKEQTVADKNNFLPGLDRSGRTRRVQSRGRHFVLRRLNAYPRKPTRDRMERLE